MKKYKIRNRRPTVKYLTLVYLYAYPCTEEYFYVKHLIFFFLLFIIQYSLAPRSIGRESGPQSTYWGRDEIEVHVVYLPSQLERTPQLCT